MPTKLISFGSRHGKPDGEELSDGTTYQSIDIRPLFGRNPYHNKKLRKLRGTDPEVQADILLTPNFDYSLSKLRSLVSQSQAEIIYIGCTGGHHRSVYLVERLGKEMGIEIFHRDIDKP